MAESRIRIVVEADDRASRNLRNIGAAMTNMGGQARGVGDSLRNVFEFAGGQLVADGIRNIAGSLVDLGGGQKKTGLLRSPEAVVSRTQQAGNLIIACPGALCKPIIAISDTSQDTPLRS